MRGRGAWVLIVLAGCAAPDLQESAPVTRVIHSYFYQDGSDQWSADVMREALGEPGSVKVIGPGPVARAQDFAAQACGEEGGTFRTGVQASETPIKGSANNVYQFELVCE